MPTIKRSDGIQFVMQSYRELMIQQPPSLLKREIRLLAQKQGEYICLVKLANGQFEAVFARELGFLLGESVWNHLQKPRNLILCEALPEENYVLLVVVKAGSVYIDAKVPCDSLAEDLAFLATSHEKYDVFVYGEVPLVHGDAETAKKDVVILEKESVNSFTILPESVLPKINPSDEFRLQPLALVLTSAYFKNKYVAPIAILIISVLLIFLAWHWFFSVADVDKGAEQSPPQKDPYVLYNEALTTATPNQLMVELGNVIALCSRLGGWDVVSISYANGFYAIKVKAGLGTVQQLQLLAKTHGINISGSEGDVVTLSINTSVAKRVMPSHIYNLNKVISILTERMQLVMAKENINIGVINNYGATKSVEVALNFKSFAPLTFALIGKMMANLPLSISSITLNNEQGLYSGSIKVTIWGN